MGTAACPCPPRPVSPALEPAASLTPLLRRPDVLRTRLHPGSACPERPQLLGPAPHLRVRYFRAFGLLKDAQSQHRCGECADRVEPVLEEAPFTDPGHRISFRLPPFRVSGRRPRQGAG